MSVTQITSTGGTISISPAGGTGVVDIEAVGTPIANLANGVGFIAATDPVPFEHTANTNTYRVTAAELVGMGAVKPAVNAVAVTNISSLSGPVTVDSSALTVGQLVLLTAQTTQYQNGPWVIQSGAWTRPAWYYSDATGGGTYSTYASSSQAFAGVTMQSLGGALHSGTTWQLTTTGTITIDSSSTGSSAWSQVTGGTGVVGAPAGPPTAVQYNNNNSLAGTGNFTFTNSTNTLTVGGGTSGAGTITTGSTGTSSVGYELGVQAGAGGATSGNGGPLFLRGGSTSNGAGGAVYIAGGAGTGANSGGIISIVAGNPGPTGNGGDFNAQAGNGGSGGGNGGSIGFTAGRASAATSNGGGIYFQGGPAETTGTGGPIAFLAGYSNSATGGGLQFLPGTGATSPTNVNDGTTQFITAQGQNALCIDQNGNTINGFLAGATAGLGGLGAYVDQGYYLPATAPVTGGTFTIPAYTSAAIVNPAGALAAQTFVFPANPVDGQLLEISFTKAITTPTWPAAVLGGPATITANSGYSWRWIASLTKWVRRF